MLKKFTAILLAFIISLSALPILAATDYDEEGAYWECYTLYPDFVNKVKKDGITDSQIIKFLASVEDYLLEQDEELSEENFDALMFAAIKHAFELRIHKKLRNAFVSAYPSAATEASKGVVPEAFMPVYNTVKRFLFGIKTPVITLSAAYTEGETVIYAHSAHLPEDCRVTIALYDEDGTLLHTKAVTPNVEEDGFHCTCGNVKSAGVFAWDMHTLSPLCDSYELIL